MYYLISMNKSLFLLACLLLSSCVVTRTEGDQMQADIDKLKNEVAKLQRAQSDMDIRLQSRLSESKRQLVTMQEAFDHIQRLGAETDLQKDQVLQQVRELTGRVEEMEHRVGKVEPMQATQPNSKEKEVQPVVVPEVAAVMPEGASPEELFAMGKEAYDQDAYSKAVTLFDAFLANKDEKKNRDNAYYWKGEALFHLAARADAKPAKQKYYKQAVLEFQNVLTQFPKSSKVEACLYKIGLSMDALGFPADAKVFFEEILDKHPKSTLVQPAKKQLQSVMQRLQSGKQTKKP